MTGFRRVFKVVERRRQVVHALAPNSIVVGVDGSDRAVEALRQAAELGRLLHTDLQVVCAWNSPDADTWDPEGQAMHAARDSVRVVYGDDWPAGLEVFSAKGDAADILIGQSSTARLLVVGRRGHGGTLERALLGSVSAMCASRAECSVLVVREPRAEG